MDKLGVVMDEDQQKTAEKEGEPKCPQCGSLLMKNVNVLQCPKCGTAPFEKK